MKYEELNIELGVTKIRRKEWLSGDYFIPYSLPDCEGVWGRRYNCSVNEVNYLEGNWEYYEEPRETLKDLMKYWYKKSCGVYRPIESRDPYNNSEAYYIGEWLSYDELKQLDRELPENL